MPAEARQATHASEAGFLRLAAPAGHQPVATTCQDGSQCARSSDFFSGGAGAGNLNFYGESSGLFVCLFSLLSFLF